MVAEEILRDPSLFAWCDLANELAGATTSPEPSEAKETAALALSECVDEAMVGGLVENRIAVDDGVRADALTARGVESMPSAASLAKEYEDLCVHREAVVARLLEKVGWDGGSGVEGMASVFDVDAHTGGGQTVSARRKAGSKTPLFVAAGDAKPLADLLARHSALARAEYLLPGSEEFDLLE